MIKKCFYFSLLSLLPIISFCQEEFNARLYVEGRVSEVAVSPSEEIWVATRAGNTYYTKGVGQLWSFGSLGSKDDSYSVSNGTFERINFFSEDTMMISGFIFGDHSNTDFIYRSTNHGKTWDKVKFGADSWIDAFYCTNNGKAWMSGSFSTCLSYRKCWRYMETI